MKEPWSATDRKAIPG